MQEIRQSTEVKVRIGSAVDASDGVTPETTLALSTADQAELLKHDGAATVSIAANTFAAITGVDGWYDLTLTSGNADTLGQITVVVQDSSLMAPIFRDFMVVKANYWDSKYSTDLLQVDVQHIDNTNAGANLLSLVTSGYDENTSKIQGVVLADTVTTYTGNTPQTADNNTILAHADYGNAKLVRATTPANTLDVAATGESGLDFANIKDATGAHTLTNITVPVTTAVTNEVTADMVKISGDSTAANNLESQYDATGLSGDTFPATQAQIGNISSGTASTNTISDSVSVTTGSETNAYTDTAALDGTSHIISPVGGVTDFYYEFDVGANGVPAGVAWEGYAESQGDSYSIYAWNWTGTPAWEQIGSKAGVNGTTIVAEAYSLTTAHVGTGSDAGKVRIRVQSSDGTSFGTDRILCSFATVYRSAGYSDGAIWVDTNNGSAGTVDYINGTADNPCNTWAAAKTLSTSIGIKKFNIVNGSSITMDASCDNFTFVGFDYTLALGGQSFENAHISEARVSGIGTAGSGTIHFHRCNVGTTSLGKAHFHNCGFNDVVTATAAVTYIFDNCFNNADGSTPPAFDFGGAVGNTHVGGRNWHGGVEIRNLGATGTDMFSLTGAGSVVIASTCSGGTIKVVGSFTITDNVGGGFAGTIADDARYDVGQINDEVADVYKVDTTSEPTQGNPPSTPTSEEMQKYLYFRMMNENRETTSEHAVYNVAGDTKVIKAAVTDSAGVLTKAKFVSGA